MKFSISRAVLFKALSHVQSVVERRNSPAILANVKIEALSGSDGEFIALTTTNTDMEMSEKIKASVDTAGLATVSAQKLYEIVRKLPDGADVVFASGKSKNQISVTAGKVKFQLATLPAEDFYTLPQENMTVSFVIAASDLALLIAKTQFAIALEETRHYLNGIYMHELSKGGSSVLRVAATDGHRLACIEMPLPKGAEGMPGIIIPRKTIVEVLKLLEEQADAMVDVSLSPAMICFKVGSVVLISKLIDGTYPDYERVIPEGNEKVMEMSAKVLMDAVDRVSVIAEKTRAVKLSMQKNKLMVSASNADEGSAEEELDAVYKDALLEIGFNYRYLLDILSQIKSGKVKFTFSDAMSPAVVHEAEHTGSVYVLMPMRI